MYRGYEKSRRRRREKLIRQCTVALAISGVLFAAVALCACIYLQNPTVL